MQLNLYTTQLCFITRIIALPCNNAWKCNKATFIIGRHSAFFGWGSCNNENEIVWFYLSEQALVFSMQGYSCAWYRHFFLRNILYLHFRDLIKLECMWDICCSIWRLSAMLTIQIDLIINFIYRKHPFSYYFMEVWKFTWQYKILFASHILMD